VDEDGAGGALVGPVDRAGDLAAARADEPDEADHLPRPHLEGHRADAVPGADEVRDLEDDVAGPPVLPHVERVDLAADHPADDLLLGELTASRGTVEGA